MDQRLTSLLALAHETVKTEDADHCPFCGYRESRVVDTNRPKRRRECLNPECKRRYNTREVIDAA